jgi:hypothetical protein
MLTQIFDENGRPIGPELFKDLFTGWMRGPLAPGKAMVLCEIKDFKSFGNKVIQMVYRNQLGISKTASIVIHDDTISFSHIVYPEPGILLNTFKDIRNALTIGIYGEYEF